MLEVRVTRSGNKYDIITNNEKVGYGIMTSSFSTLKFNFFSYSDSSMLATYNEKRRLFFPNKRRIFFNEMNIECPILNGLDYYSIVISDSIYTLKYGVLKIKGFFLNDIKVGDIEILKSSNLAYEKRIIFSDEIKNYLPLVYLFIAIDYNDFN